MSESPFSSPGRRRIAAAMLFCAALVCAAFGARKCAADTIVLDDGSSITGTVLAEKQSEIIIDLGVDILRIPRDRITLHAPADANSIIAEPNLPAPAAEDTSRLYRTAALEPTTIEKCVEEFAEAVVKITSAAGTGSGFFINSDGYLVTNYHVIEKETRIQVTLFRKTQNGLTRENLKKVKIIAINPFVDLALLKIEDLPDDKVKYVYLGDIGRVSAGQTVFAVGNPLGLERTVSQGIISTTNRAQQGLVYIQTTTDINPGNSGGPLFNLAGEVVGVTNMGYIYLGGLNFAIPVNYLKDFIDNRDAFAYDKDNPNSGYRYLQPPPRQNKQNPPLNR